jgi:hypothetical protein
VLDCPLPPKGGSRKQKVPFRGFRGENKGLLRISV